MISGPLFTLLTALTVAATAPPGALPGDCLERDDEGRPFPTCFDPGRGLEFGVGFGHRSVLTEGRAGDGLVPELRVGLLWRTARESRSRHGSLWMMEHRFLSARAVPTAALREAQLTLWEGTFRRHVPDGFILVPTQSPLRLPFPFDVALHARAGTWERRVFDGPGARLEVLRAALLLDPVRASSGRFRLGLGPALGYALRTHGGPWAHEVVPFTSAALEVAAESADGWWSFRLSAVAGWVTVPGVETFFRASGQAHLERLLVAVNDEPLWLRAFVRAAERDAGVLRATEVAGGLGLVLRLWN